MFSDATLPKTCERAIHRVIKVTVDADVDIILVAGKTLDNSGNCFLIRAAFVAIFDSLNVIFSLSFCRDALMDLARRQDGKEEKKKSKHPQQSKKTLT